MEIKIYSKHAALNGIEAVKRTQIKGTELHWHDCCEVELVLDGRGTHTINGHCYPIEPGDLYFFTPADCHSITAQEPLTVFGIMFEEKLLEEELYTSLLSLETKGMDLLVKPSKEKCSLLEQYFATIVKETGRTQEMFSHSYIVHLLNGIVIELLREMDADTVDEAQRQNIMKAILYLHRHYAEPITLASLASMLYLSPSYLSACFKANIGRSFKEYLIHLRLSHACRLLVNTNMSVTDICYHCGFTSYPNFMRAFRNHYEMAPLQFRRQYKRMPE